MTWASDMQDIHTQAGGLVCLHVFRRVDVPGLIADAAAGNAEAFQLANALSVALTRIKTAPRRLPTLCSCCDRALRAKVDFAVVIAVPHRADASRYLAFGVCPKCGPTPDEIRAKAFNALSRIWPSAREITINVQHTAGNA